jgi:hypothetical protein
MKNEQAQCPNCKTPSGNGIYPSVNAKGNYIDKWECDNCLAKWRPEAPEKFSLPRKKKIDKVKSKV